MMHSDYWGVDFQELFKKYMKHVYDCEGATFSPFDRHCGEIEFTQAEFEYMQMIDDKCRGCEGGL